jgi:hypothetical protein
VTNLSYGHVAYMMRVVIERIDAERPEDAAQASAMRARKSNSAVRSNYAYIPRIFVTMPTLLMATM